MLVVYTMRQTLSIPFLPPHDGTPFQKGCAAIGQMSETIEERVPPTPPPISPWKPLFSEEKFPVKCSQQGTVFLHPALCQRGGPVGTAVVERCPGSFGVSPYHEVLSEQLPRHFSQVEEANDGRYGVRAPRCGDTV